MITTRRAFLNNVGKGMLLASLGTALTADLDVNTAWANEPAYLLDGWGDPLPAGAVAQLGTRRFHHGGIVSNVLVTSDRKTLVSNSFYGTRAICIWEAATGRLVRELPGVYDERRIALSPDDKTLAAADHDAIRLWDLASGKMVRSLKGHPNPLNPREPGGAHGLAFSPDGETLASGSVYDGTVRLWNVATGRQVASAPTDQQVRFVAFSPDGEALATGGYCVASWSISCSCQTTTHSPLRLWKRYERPASKGTEMANRGNIKGAKAEETIRSVFRQQGFFVVRGVPYTFQERDVTDIDLWLYGKSGPFRERINVDIQARISNWLW